MKIKVGKIGICSGLSSSENDLQHWSVKPEYGGWSPSLAVKAMAL